MTSPLVRPEITATTTTILPPVVIATDTFETDSNFVNSVGATARQFTGDGHSGVWVLRNRTSSATGAIRRDITGLVIGERYEAGIWINTDTTGVGNITGAWIKIEALDPVSEIARSSDILPGHGTIRWRRMTVDFTAPATTVRIRAEYDASGTTMMDFDDFRLRHLPAAVTVGDITLTEGTVTLDDSWAPYGQGSITAPMVPANRPALAPVDPRAGSRIILGATESVSGSVRTFNLALRDRTTHHRTGQETLALETDESALQDYAPIRVDHTPRGYEASLRQICNYVIGQAVPGAQLEPGSTDADMSAYWEVTNLIPNPSVVSTVDTFYVAAAGTSAVDYSTSIGGAYGTSCVRWTADSTESSRISAGTFTASGGETYTGSAYIYSPNSRDVGVILYFRGPAGELLLATRSPTVTAGPNWRTRVSHTFTAPEGTAQVGLHIERLAGGSTGDYTYADAVMLYEGDELIPYFQPGESNPGYAQSWLGQVHASQSTRYPTLERPPESLVWESGVTAWEFLTPLLSAAGLRLFCDELRRWHLVNDDTYTVPGTLTLTTSTVEDRINLITSNSRDAETGSTSGWEAITPSATVSTTTDKAHTGSRSYKITTTGAGAVTLRAIPGLFPGIGSSGVTAPETSKAWLWAEGPTPDVTDTLFSTNFDDGVNPFDATIGVRPWTVAEATFARSAPDVLYTGNGSAGHGNTYDSTTTYAREDPAEAWVYLSSVSNLGLGGLTIVNADDRAQYWSVVIDPRNTGAGTNSSGFHIRWQAGASIGGLYLAENPQYGTWYRVRAWLNAAGEPTAQLYNAAGDFLGETVRSVSTNNFTNAHFGVYGYGAVYYDDYSVTRTTPGIPAPEITYGLQEVTPAGAVVKIHSTGTVTGAGDWQQIQTTGVTKDAAANIVRPIWQTVGAVTFYVDDLRQITGTDEAIFTEGNVTDVEDILTRDSTLNPWADAVRVVYRWSRKTASMERIDVAGTSGKVVTFEVEKPYPGRGAAENILKRLQDGGKTQTIEALVNYTATPGQEVTITLPATPTHTGKLANVEFDFATGLMNVETKQITEP